MLRTSSRPDPSPPVLDLRAFDATGGDVTAALQMQTRVTAERDFREAEERRMRQYARQRKLAEEQAAAERAWIEQQKIDALKRGEIPDLSGNPFQRQRDLQRAYEREFVPASYYPHVASVGYPTASSYPGRCGWQRPALFRHRHGGGTAVY